MATSGKKFRKRNYITLEAPVMYVDKAPVWMDRHWFPNFCDFLTKKSTLVWENSDVFCQTDLMVSSEFTLVCCKSTTTTS